MADSSFPTAQAGFILSLEPHGWQAEAPAELTLLEAAQFAGIKLPSSCRNGTCRTCMCRMTEGRVRYEIPWPGLSTEEKVEGYILPCVAYPESDVRIAVPAAQKLPT